MKACAYDYGLANEIENLELELAELKRLIKICEQERHTAQLSGLETGFEHPMTVKAYHSIIRFLSQPPEEKRNAIVDDIVETENKENDAYLVNRLKRCVELINNGDHHMAVAKLLADISALTGERGLD